MNKPLERKLAAIMFADIVSYSRMMGSNEGEALKILSDFDSISIPIIEKFNGILIKKNGDEIFCEFTSAKNAVDASMEIQNNLSSYNDSRPKNFKLEVRIGIHIGDVVKKDGDIFGDGVNVASRIQPLATPGGICISGLVSEALSSHPEYNITSIGKPELKHIVQQHSIYDLKTGHERKVSIRNKGLNIKSKLKNPAYFIALIIAILGFYFSYVNLLDDENITISNYLVNISSSDHFKNNYYTDYGYNSLFYSSEKYIVSKMDKEILNEIKSNLQQKLLIDYAATPVNIEINFNSVIEETLDSLNFPKLGGIVDEDEGLLFKNILTIHSPMYKSFKEDLKIGLFRIFIYKVHDIRDSKDHIIIDPAFQVWGKNSWQSPREYNYDQIDDIIKYLYKYIKKYIQHTTYSSSQIGEVVEVIDGSLVKIKEYKSGIFKKGLKLIISRNYKWSKGGAETRKEDLEHLKEYFKANGNNDKVVDIDRQINMIDKNINNKSYRDDTNSIIGGDIAYRMKIIDVIDSLAIAKIISNDNMRFIVRKGDLISLDDK